MLGRCFYPACDRYKNYGGRGITVCPEWLSFENFYRDMGDRPSPKHSLDRIDVNGHYCKENCRWATPKEQQNNRSNNRVVEFNGEVRTLAGWAEYIGINYHTLCSRIYAGWSEEAALTTPLKEKRIEEEGKR
jgi:hypothetical protein